METRYYSEKGRSGGEHKLALHASKKVFDRITGHLYRKERIREDLEREAAHRKYLRDEGRAMTSQWENSVENLRKKKEEERQQRLAQKADDRVEQYFKVLKWQAEQRKIFNEEVKKKIFVMRGSQRDINSGVLFSECLYFNEKNIEHKTREKEKADKDWKEFEQQIIREDKEFKDNELIKECKRRTAAENHLKFLKNQISGKQKNREEEQKLNLEIEISDIARQKKEMEIIRKNAEEDFLKAKRCSMKILKDSREEAIKKRQLEEKQNAELERVCEIYRDTRTRINCAREVMKKKDIQKRLDFQEEAFKKLEEIQNQILDTEGQRIANAVAEKEEADALKRRMREEYDERLLKERKENYENALQEEKRKKDEEKEKRKWQMLNRIKLIEICKEEEERREENKLKKRNNYRGLLDEQVKKNEEIRAEKKAEEDAFIWNDFPEEDRKFLEYGEEMLAKQKSEGKPTYPIQLAITQYKKKHSLLADRAKISSTKKEENGSKKGMKLPIINRRICPNKNDSSGFLDCFCTD
ncbi:trichohyalin-like [Coccinella septempunctata]|uniref:trichohyalin-like n=1 Tax=Coccinella septempunctata TaxID=41139 RepID=UPI001D0799B5|nr:trichohyalin-like [Coccinella septempunctata]